jgi:hypothetical protein
MNDDRPRHAHPDDRGAEVRSGLDAEIDVVFGTATRDGTERRSTGVASGPTGRPCEGAALYPSRAVSSIPCRADGTADHDTVAAPQFVSIEGLVLKS